MEAEPCRAPSARPVPPGRPAGARVAPSSRIGRPGAVTPPRARAAPRPASVAPTPCRESAGRRPAGDDRRTRLSPGARGGSTLVRRPHDRPPLPEPAGARRKDHLEAPGTDVRTDTPEASTQSPPPAHPDAPRRSRSRKPATRCHQVPKTGHQVPKTGRRPPIRGGNPATRARIPATSAGGRFPGGGAVPDSAGRGLRRDHPPGRRRSARGKTCRSVGGAGWGGQARPSIG